MSRSASIDSSGGVSVSAEDMTLAAMKCLATSMRAASFSPPTMTMYAPMTLPAIVANPPTMTHMSCERVMRAMNGLTVRGASV